jgi:DNA-binding NarL/FixJ family response regulator
MKGKAQKREQGFTAEEVRFLRESANRLVRKHGMRVFRIPSRYFATLSLLEMGCSAEEIAWARHVMVRTIGQHRRWLAEHGWLEKEEAS